MKKKLVVLLLCFFPLFVNASNNLKISCEKTSLLLDETTKCKIMANSDYGVTGVSGIIKLSNGLDLVSIEHNTDFQGGANNGVISLYTDSSHAKSGSFVVVKNFVIKAKSISNNETITVNKPVFARDSSGNFASVNISSNTLSLNIRVPSSDNSLKSLTIDGTSANINNGKVNLTTDKSVVVIKTVTNDSKAKVSGAGKVNVKYGTNTYNVVVTAENGSKKTYPVVITRKDNRSNDNSLKSLSIEGETLFPTFSSGDTKYSLSTDKDVLVIDAIANNSKAKVSGAGRVNVKYGTNTYNVVVTAENESKKTYEISISRNDNRDSDNTLKSLTISDGKLNQKFNPDVLEYTLYVLNTIDKITISPVLNSEKSNFVFGYGEKEINLSEDIGVVEIKVLAENETERTYKININKVEKYLSSNTNLNELSVSGHDINFDNDNNLYYLELDGNESYLDIKAIPEDSDSTVTIEGNNELKKDSLVLVNVKSTDGTVKSYALVVKQNEKNSSFVYIIFAIICVLMFFLGIFCEKKNLFKHKG